MTENSLQISYSPQAKPEAMTAMAIGTLTEIASSAQIQRFMISSTSRSINDQARIMFEETQRNGVSYMRNLYAAAGQEVIAVYEAQRNQHRSASEIKMAMALKITELGPHRISNHIVTPDSALCVFDIAPSSVLPQSRRSEFELAIENHDKVARFFKPPRDKAYHLEIRP